MLHVIPSDKKPDKRRKKYLEDTISTFPRERRNNFESDCSTARNASKGMLLANDMDRYGKEMYAKAKPALFGMLK